MEEIKRRYITHVKRSLDWDITEICNPIEPWSSVSKKDAIREIESSVYQYFVNWGAFSTQIKVVVNKYDQKYLRTDKDNTKRNNLEELPDCY
jgi:hypothetical protein